MRAALSWIFATLMLSVIIHIITIHTIPYAVMHRAMSRMSENAGGVNKPSFPPAPTATSRGVVRPSPDLLYVACVYDVDKNPVRFTGLVPDGYWSLSFFADNSDNFYAIDDRKLPSKSVDVLLASEDQEVQPHPGETLVISPSDKGVALFRFLVTGPAAREAMDKLRHQSGCAPA
ncbi:MAG: DUF1254 domain-containing protein [Parvibaculaceae bacterium]|nr:DUF1254 domain-containing protein [Parvibaculaceae bacterium]